MQTGIKGSIYNIQNSIKNFTRHVLRSTMFVSYPAYDCAVISHSKTVEIKASKRKL